MFGFLKSLFHHSPTLEERQEEAHVQDREVRESLSEKQIDKELKDTMDASDPTAKF
jgi:hypothetical protein